MHSSENNSPGQAMIESSEGMCIHKNANQKSVVDKLLQHQMNMGSNDEQVYQLSEKSPGHAQLGSSDSARAHGRSSGSSN